MACTLAESPSDPLHRKLRQLRCLRRRFDCYRVERTSSRAGVSPAEVQRLFTAHCFVNYPNQRSNLTSFLGAAVASSITVKAKKPTLKQVQAVRCPTCGAGPGEKCELTTGLPRTEPHRDRRLIAEDDLVQSRRIRAT
jgi:AraC-like DNA-binding protein